MLKTMKNDKLRNELPRGKPLGIEGSIEARPLIRSKLRGMDPRGIQNGKILKFFILHFTFIIIPQGVNSADKKTI
jgi:hypothetical protein